MIKYVFMTKIIEKKSIKKIHVIVYLKTMKYVNVRNLVLNYRIFPHMKIVLLVINGNVVAKPILTIYRSTICI